MNVSAIEGGSTREGDPLRLERCPDCGYLLHGLPEQGVCPECGFEYGPEMIVLYGWGTGNRWTVFNGSRWSIISSALVPWVFPLMQLMTGHFLGFSMRGFGLLLLGLLALDGVLLYGRWRAGGEIGKPAQLRLCSQGYAQRTGSGRANLHPWRRGMQISMTMANGRRCVIQWAPFLPVRRAGLIDMEFDCDPTTAARIHKRFNQWCAAAGR